jgi:uncharacterized membrane protein YgdD (TMEM256/DUF423 family)
MTATPPADRSSNTTILAAALLGLLGVAAGAFGAHGIEARISSEQLEWWATAARYQQIHAVALLALGFAAGPWSRWRSRAAWCFVIGIVVFAGTLYAMALGGPRILGAITPLGGLALICGWGSIGGDALARRRAVFLRAGETG